MSELLSDLIYVYSIDSDGVMKTIWYTGKLREEFSPQLTEEGHSRLWRPIVHPDDAEILDRRTARLASRIRRILEGASSRRIF